jgi:hypothetical protein
MIAEGNGGACVVIGTPQHLLGIDGRERRVADEA